MKKYREFLASLDASVTLSRRELTLGIAAAALAGVVVGVFASPRKAVAIGSYNGNGNGNGSAVEGALEGETLFHDKEE